MGDKKFAGRGEINKIDLNSYSTPILLFRLDLLNYITFDFQSHLLLITCFVKVIEENSIRKLQ